ncbi:MAG: ADP-ribosylglycohydrolase family protein [Ruminococcaceae bacterium]|nr:ADP-ribosylglycohydrolase family protein [Oscillospiraceae bacterium]
MFAKIYNTEICPDYSNADGLNRYPQDLLAEYNQSMEEGLDVERYKGLFEEVASLEAGDIKTRMSDLLFELVINAGTQPGYQYDEPSALEEIQALRSAHDFAPTQPDNETLRKKILGAWTGRAVGCLLGKPLEGIRSDELIPFLKETDNYPLHRYPLSSEITKEIASHYKFMLCGKPYADTMDGMPVDDDTNYLVLAQKIVNECGKDFESDDVVMQWLRCQSVYAYFTAERIAFVNFMNCLEPPASAMYKNVCREWIGAQIRGDYFGYICPGKPEEAARMAYTDARISHVKNGIYGEMFVAAMIACAAVTDNIEDIILGGLAQIPYTSRLYEAVVNVMDAYKTGKTYDETFAMIHALWDEHTDHGWCHVISNAMIVTAALLYGEGDFGKSVCAAVGMAFDTDCNGATVGSILGMRNGIDGIDEYWQKPINGKIHTSIFGIPTVNIEEAAELTMKHIED